jgi:hypothetical protein
MVRTGNTLNEVNELPLIQGDLLNETLSKIKEIPKEVPQTDVIEDLYKSQKQLQHQLRQLDFFQ